MELPQQQRGGGSGPLQNIPDTPIPTQGCPQPTCSRVRVKSGGCPAWLAFSSKSLWLWLSREIGLRVIFIFSKAVEISPVYCQSKGSRDGARCWPLTVLPSASPVPPALPPRPWHPHAHLADVQELVQGHGLVQVQRLPQGSISLALPVGGEHGAENRAGEGHPLPGARPHSRGQVALRSFPGMGACPQPGQVGQAAPIPGSIRGR